MKKLTTIINKGMFTSAIVFTGLTGLTGCGTILGGKIETCQKVKPTMTSREIRPFALAGDILLAPIALPIDFYTGGIYKPCNKYDVNIEHKPSAIRKMVKRQKKDQ